MVEYSAKLVKDIEEILRGGFGNEAIVLNRKSNRNWGPFHVTLQDTNEPGTRMLDGRFASPIQKNGIESKLFYFGFVALFEVTQSGEEIQAHVLEHVSLHIFQTYPVGSLYSIVRAEWDNSVIGDPRAFHAQPHWHFTQNAKEIEQMVRTVSGDDMEFGGSLVFDNYVSLSDAHFAMSQLWDATNNNSYKRDFLDYRDFIGWFRQLVKYIAAQLAYICGGQASEIMEFGG